MVIIKFVLTWAKQSIWHLVKGCLFKERKMYLTKYHNMYSNLCRITTFGKFVQVNYGKDGRLFSTISLNRFTRMKIIKIMCKSIKSASSVVYLIIFSPVLLVHIVLPIVYRSPIHKQLASENKGHEAFLWPKILNRLYLK